MKVCLSMAIGTSIIVIAGLWCPKFASKNSGFLTIISSVMVAGAWLIFPQLKTIFSDVGYLMLLVTGTTFVVSSILDRNKVTKPEKGKISYT